MGVLSDRIRQAQEGVAAIKSLVDETLAGIGAIEKDWKRLPSYGQAKKDRENEK